MKVTYNWLRDYVDTPLTPEEIAAKLPLIGFEVDSFASTLPDIDGVLIGRVVSCEPLPKSDHLKQCQVDIGGQQLNVVCGAPNVASDQTVVVAPPGTRLPNGLTIEERPIMGVVSQGMICSESELGLSDEAGGIMVLDDDIQPGRFFREIAESDYVYDIDVTPNRPDALGVIGIAREIGLLTNTPMKLRRIRLKEEGQSIDRLIKIQIKDPIGCPRYAARIVQNTEVGSSPGWLKKRLQSVGIRSISNVVDVTNYVMMETGQPLHAFDYVLLGKKKIIIQRARGGQLFETLDEQKHELRDTDLLICDGEKAVAMAGVMGGLNSEVSTGTNHVLIECAHFNPTVVRRTAKSCGISSEAARRFERGTDPNGVPFALRRAAQLMQLTGGGQIARGEVDVYPKRIRPARVPLRPKRVNQILGCRVSPSKIEKIMLGLECKVSKKAGSWSVSVPTFRPDLTREIDLIEEVARVHGYDKIPEKFHSNIAIGDTTSRPEEFIEKLRQTLVGLGFDEAVTFNLTGRALAEAYVHGDREVLPLVNPLNEDMSVMRPSIVSTLLQALSYNLNRKNADVWLFEIGSIFWRNGSQAICENQSLTALATGHAEILNWIDSGRALEIHDIRGVVETLLRRVRIPEIELHAIEQHQYFQLGWQIKGVNGQDYGFAGQLASDLLNRYNVEEDVFGFELNIDHMLADVRWERKVHDIPKFPAVERDLAIVVDNAIPAGEIAGVIRKAGGSSLESVTLFDLYKGRQVPDGKKSMAFALKFRDFERTLTDQEVDQWLDEVLNRLAQDFDARLR